VAESLDCRTLKGWAGERGSRLHKATSFWRVYSGSLAVSSKLHDHDHDYVSSILYRPYCPYNWPLNDAQDTTAIAGYTVRETPRRGRARRHSPGLSSRLCAWSNGQILVRLPRRLESETGVCNTNCDTLNVRYFPTVARIVFWLNLWISVQTALENYKLWIVTIEHALWVCYDLH